MLHETRPLTANGRGANLYLGIRLLDDRLCPVAPGNEVVVQTIPNRGLLVLPDEPEYPVEVTLHDPAQYANQSFSPTHGNE